MKPILLSIKAFGAFTQKQVIDFRVFEKNHLFLIHGSTGAGKTTIFDAMCYAIYGDTSSGRKAESMRAERAKTDEHTIVRFVFSVGAEYYLAERKIIRIKKQNTKEKDKTQKQDTEQTTEITETKKTTETKKNEVEYKTEQHFGRAIPNQNHTDFDWDGQVLSKVNEIKEAVDKLLGFKLEQFKQIILIPQGEFQKLLKSGSEQKKEILEKIFDAEIYSQITQKLQEKYRKKEEDLKNLRQSYTQKLNFLQVVSETDVHEKIQQYIQRLEVAKQNLPELEKNFQEANTQLEKARQQSETYQRWEKARQSYTQHLAQEPQIQIKENSLKIAQKADTLKDDFRKLSENETRLQKLEKEISQKQIAETQIKDELTKILQKFNALEIQKNNTEDKIKEKNRLENLTPKYAQRNTWVQKVGDLQDDLYNFQNQSNNTLQNIDDREKEITATQINITNNKILSEKIEPLEQKIKENKRLYELRKQIFEIEETQRLALDELKTAQKVANDYHQKNQQARQYLEEIEKKWLGSQASLLAQNLQENQPCPVCGAIHHPKKAQVTNETINQHDWENAKQQRDEIEKFFQRSQENYYALQHRMESIKKEYEILAQQLGENKHIDLYDLEKELRKLENDLKKAEQARKNLPHFENSLENLHKSLKLLEDTAQFQQQQKRSIELELNELNTKIRSILLELPTHLSSIEQLQKEIKKIDTEVAGFDKNFTEILQKKNEKETELIQTQSLLQSKQTEAEHEKNHIEPQKKAFLEKIQQNNFFSIEEWQNALMPTEKMQTIQSQIQQWHENKRLLASQTETLENDLANTQEIPNINTFKQQAEEATLQFKETAQKIAQLEQLKKSITQQLTEIQKNKAEIAKKEQENYPLYELTSLAKGENSLKQDFQTHVLTAFLDEVMGYANARLRLLSDERYELRRTDNVDDGRTRQAGLNLVVFDNHTGNERSVHNLSGGETFFTSLALALGLADVATSKAGGIQLGAMFIDEGFGTLDSHTLDRALTTLSNLDGQYRMVGIISHVAELKERIKNRVEVIKEQNGSKILIKQ